MFATKMITATLVLSGMALAQTPGLEDALPAVSGLRTGPLRGASIDVYIEQPGGLPSGQPAPSAGAVRLRAAGAAPTQGAGAIQGSTSAGSQLFIEYTEGAPDQEADDGDAGGRAPEAIAARQGLIKGEDEESFQLSQQVPGSPGGLAAVTTASTASGQLVLDGTSPGDVRDAPIALPVVELLPGTSIMRCGVTVASKPESGSAVVLSSDGAGCFTDILVSDGAHASIDVAADASSLEFLQVTVMGRAFLDVTGEQGLGHYDPREFAETRAGIVVDGEGLTASDQEQMATITLESSRNVVETLGASRNHEIRVPGDSNLVRLHGEDRVHSDGLDVRVRWMAPMFLQ